MAGSSGSHKSSASQSRGEFVYPAGYSCAFESIPPAAVYKSTRCPKIETPETLETPETPEHRVPGDVESMDAGESP